MRDSFSRVDDVLIDRLFQPLADWMNDALAFGTNRAARTALDLASLAWILAQAGALAAAMASHDAVHGIVRGGLLVLGLWAFTLVRGVFQRADGNGKRTEANPLRPAMQLHRAICFFWMIGLAVQTLAAPSATGALALLAMALFTTAAVYIGACSNDPPGQRNTSRDLAFGFGRI